MNESTNMPTIEHPKTFEIDGLFFKVVAYITLTDRQAANVAMHFFRTHKFKKKDKGKTFTVITTIDTNSSGMW